MAASGRAGSKRRGRVKRPNPIARVLRGPAFRAKKQRNRRRYSRKGKQQSRPESDEA